MIALDTVQDRRAWTDSVRIRPTIFRAGLGHRAATGPSGIAPRAAIAQTIQASEHEASDDYFRR